jgi:hypothetical protein
MPVLAQAAALCCTAAPGRPLLHGAAADPKSQAPGWRGKLRTHFPAARHAHKWAHKRGNCCWCSCRHGTPKPQARRTHCPPVQASCWEVAPPGSLCHKPVSLCDAPDASANPEPRKTSEHSVTFIDRSLGRCALRAPPSWLSLSKRFAVPRPAGAHALSPGLVRLLGSPGPSHVAAAEPTEPEACFSIRLLGHSCAPGAAAVRCPRRLPKPQPPQVSRGILANTTPKFRE